MKDLFEYPERLTEEGNILLKEMNKQFNSDWDYINCERYKAQFELIGYSFDYDLSATPYNLAKI